MAHSGKGGLAPVALGKSYRDSAQLGGHALRARQGAGPEGAAETLGVPRSSNQNQLSIDNDSAWRVVDEWFDRRLSHKTRAVFEQTSPQQTLSGVALPGSEKEHAWRIRTAAKE